MEGFILILKVLLEILKIFLSACRVRHNVENMVAAISVALNFGVKSDQVVDLGKRI